ncbi:MAG TPA: SDR family oxidoreductase [Burkholderiaceae bacterium]|nr:SDR family oxidoreductase [Burkholderiaceae bacterium]
MTAATPTTEASAALEVIAEARHAHVPEVAFAGVQWHGLRGRGVIVTGGANGIGADIVRGFAAQGCAVGFLDRDEPAGQALAAALPGAHFQHCDVTDVPALQAAMATLAARVGSVDVLVNNVGRERPEAIDALTPEAFDARIAVDLRPHVFATQAVLGSMRERGGGSIVNLGGARSAAERPGLALHAACKAALGGLTRSLARELGADGIRVNCVLPGWVMTQRQLDERVDAATERALDRHQSLPGRIVGADIAHLVMFLAADTARMITGQEFVVDAGWS